MGNVSNMLQDIQRRAGRAARNRAFQERKAEQNATMDSSTPSKNPDDEQLRLMEAEAALQKDLADRQAAREDSRALMQLNAAKDAPPAKTDVSAEDLTQLAEFYMQEEDMTPDQAIRKAKVAIAGHPSDQAGPDEDGYYTGQNTRVFAQKGEDGSLSFSNRENSPVFDSKREIVEEGGGKTVTALAPEASPEYADIQARAKAQAEAKAAERKTALDSVRNDPNLDRTAYFQDMQKQSSYAPAADESAYKRINNLFALGMSRDNIDPNQQEKPTGPGLATRIVRGATPQLQGVQPADAGVTSADIAARASKMQSPSMAKAGVDTAVQSLTDRIRKKKQIATGPMATIGVRG